MRFYYGSASHIDGILGRLFFPVRLPTLSFVLFTHVVIYLFVPLVVLLLGIIDGRPLGTILIFVMGRSSFFLCLLS